MEDNKKEEARMVSMEELLGKEIGEEGKSKEEKERESAQKELQESLQHQKPDYSFGNFTGNSSDDDDAEEDEDKDKTEETGKGESEKDIQTGPSESAEDDEPKVNSEVSDTYRKVITDMFGESAGSIVQEDEEGNEIETPLEELDIDEELFKEIVQSKIEEEKELASQGKVSTDNLSDFAKSIIEIEGNGGDVSNLLEMKKAYSDPLDQLDISTPEGKKEAIYLRKKAANPDEDDQEIQLLIEAYEKKGILDEKAEAAESELRAGFEAAVEREKEASAKLKEEREELLKKYRKDIKENLSSEFELNDKTIKRLVDMSSKAGDDGKFELDNM